MKITVEIDNVKITVDESGQGERQATLKYSDQAKEVHELIKVMADQIKKLREAVKE